MIKVTLCCSGRKAYFSKSETESVEYPQWEETHAHTHIYTYTCTHTRINSEFNVYLNVKENFLNLLKENT